MSDLALKVTLKDGSPFTIYEPHEKQLAFHTDSTTNLLAIGSRGSGKSLTLRMDAHMRALSCPGINLILVRKTYKDLLKSHIYFQGLPWGSLKKEMELLGGSFHSTDYICHYPNGSKLFLSYVGHESDALNLLSAEFVAAYFDELSVIPWDYFIKLCASVRVPMHSGLKAVVRAATNPLGESASELIRYFVTHEVDPEEDPDYVREQWGSIRMDMEDNPHLDVEQYKGRFAGLPEHVRRAWLYGEYSEEDALFTFNPNKNGKPYHVINELNVEEIVKKARIFRVYDHGYSPDPAYCAWIAHLGNRYIAFHEKLWFKTIVSDIAADIRNIDKELGIERVVGTFCDPTIDIKTGQDVRTIKDIFEEHGVPMDCSVNNREQFASHIHTALTEEVEIEVGKAYNEETGKIEPVIEKVPRLQILNGSKYSENGCPYLIKSVPLQRYNQRKPGSLADHKHDHAVVALAYFLISHASNERKSIITRDIKPWMKPRAKKNWVLGKSNVRIGN